MPISTVYVCMCQSLSCVQLFVTPMDTNLPGSSLHGILQARILEWLAIPFSRGSSWPRDRTQVSPIADGLFPVWATKVYSALFWTLRTHTLVCVGGGVKRAQKPLYTHKRSPHRKEIPQELTLWAIEFCFIPLFLYMFSSLGPCHADLCLSIGSMWFTI